MKTKFGKLMHIIHVNRGFIAKNRKDNTDLPVLSVKNKDKNTYCNRVDILDKEGNIVASVVYSPDKPLSCGARVWIEAVDVKTDISMTYQEAIGVDSHRD